MREGWKKKTLEEVCKELFAGGDVPKDRSSKTITEKFRVPIYSNGATNKGLYGYTDFARVNEPSITVSARGTIGYSEIRTENYLPVVRLIVLIPNEDIVSLLFLKYVVETMDFGNSGTSIPQLTVPMIKKHEVQIPPLQEQKQIVTILDQAFEAIDQAKANIEQNILNAKELFQSKLNDIFSQKGEGWEEKMLIDLCEEKSQIVGGPFGSNLKVVDYRDSGIPILRLQNIGKGYFIDKDIKFVSKEKAEELAYHSFVSGDIVLAKLGIPIGKTCIVPDKYEYGIVVADVVRIRPNKNIINYFFLKHFLNSQNAVQQLTDDIKGATRPRVNIAEVRNLKLSVPSIQQQHQITEIIDNIEGDINNIIKQYEKNISNLEELKKSILQKAFAGELTKNVENPLSPEQKHALLIAWSYSAHRNAGTELTFGHTKSEKMVHLFEHHAEIDLHRSPIKDAAGPNDFNRVINIIEPLAKKQKYFSVVKEPLRHTYGFSSNTFKSITKLKSQLSETQKKKAQEVIQLFLDKKMQDSELIATVYAAWNNLLINKEQINDEAIVYEARENWHDKKLEIERYKFFETIELLRVNNIVPKGTGKLVEKKTLF